MKLIVGYLLLCLVVLAWIASISLRGSLPAWFKDYSLILNCSLIGSLGGTIYCIRAVYLNRSVLGRWNSNWNIWYLLRPLVSFLVGGVSYVFLKAGLLVLDSNSQEIENPFGFLSLAFIAGLNVDKFLKKVEEVAQITWGIDQSRTALREDTSNKEEK